MDVIRDYVAQFGGAVDLILGLPDDMWGPDGSLEAPDLR